MELSPNKRKYKWPCRFALRGVVSYDGIVRVCGCRFNNNPDYDELILSKITKNRSLKDIWFSNKRKQFINKFLTGKLPTVCKTCTTYELE